MQRDKITFQLSIFEGPLDLLLYLIRTQEIDIRDIPIVKITEQYLDMLGLMKELNLDVAGEYLLMAATLIHIKSQMLLPRPAAVEDEPLEDPREELVQRLLEYERFKKVSEVLYEKASLEGASYPRGEQEPEPAGDGEGEETFDVSLVDLVAAFREVLKTQQEKPAYQIRPFRFTIKSKAEQILSVCAAKGSVSLEEILSMQGVKEELIACFLALLELVRLGAVRAYQRALWGEIRIHATGRAVNLEDLDDGGEKAMEGETP